MLKQILKKGIFLGALPFCVTFLTGVSFVQLINFFESPVEQLAPSSLEQAELRVKTGTGYASCGAHTDSSLPLKQSLRAGQLRITSKPKAVYTDEARENDIQGSVRLKVEFLRDGTIGRITPVTELPYGLTEQAINAARNIKFDPFEPDGGRSGVVKTIDYSFTIY